MFSAVFVCNPPPKKKIVCYNNIDTDSHPASLNQALYESQVIKGGNKFYKLKINIYKI